MACPVFTIIILSGEIETEGGAEKIYLTFLVYNTKISDNNAKSGKVPRMLAAFPR
jgi:hypothetical protein